MKILFKKLEILFLKKDWNALQNHLPFFFINIDMTKRFDKQTSLLVI